ncbi:CBS domain-containing protein [Acidocella sp. KAb 2-4]|uniref:CBS domain-containing protein n=1 Tax=Acidocella sp. KAb 2-4 TaxID=2885158 RepID=UPI001D086C18|nr:CBS domain-containing protein [Acidocella sp. KAb 2-4]MCB5945742.1 CBS domain-containing protein [Acidocella sp. KAb 2-4]
MTVRQILRNKPSGFISVAPEARITSVIATLAERGIGAVLVLDAGRLVGILSERDIVRSLAKHAQETLDMTATALMTPNPTTGTPETTVAEAMEVMTNGHFRHLPIMENGILTGLVSIGDVVKARIDQSQFEVDSLRTYVSGRS